jgi:formylglycine-generating enzyme required for sulfatase activity
VDDLAGGAWELTRSSVVRGDYVLRGGSFFHDRTTAQTANRNVTQRTWRDAAVGVRLCADP